MSAVDKNKKVNTAPPVPRGPRPCPKSRKPKEELHLAGSLAKEGKFTNPSKMKGVGGNAEGGRPSGSGTTGTGTVSGSVGMGLKRTGTFAGKEEGPKASSSSAPKRSRPSASSSGSGRGNLSGPISPEKNKMDSESEDFESVFDSDGETAYELDYILEVRMRRNFKEYLCKWKGQGEEKNNWVKEANFHCKPAITEFKKRMAFQKNRNGKEVAREKKQGQGGRGQGNPSKHPPK